MTATLGADIIRASDGSGPVEFPDGIITGNLNGGDISGGIATDADVAAIYGAAHNWTAGQNFRVVTTLQKAALATGNFTPLVIDPQDTGARNWNMQIGAQLFGGDGSRPDVIWQFGYNNAVGGGGEDTTDDAYYLQFESYYAPTATQRIFEFHLNYYGPSNTPSFRPLQINVNRADDATPYRTVHTLIGDSFTWGSRITSAFVPMTLSIGTDAAASAWTSYIPLALRADGVMAYFQSAAGLTQISFENDAVSVYFQSSVSKHFTITGPGGAKDFVVTNFRSVSFPQITFYNTIVDSQQSIQVAAGKAFLVNSTQVVGARVIDARCDDTINSGDATTDGVIDALRDAMIAHGLIAAA